MDVIGSLPPSQSAFEKHNRGKTNPTFLCASWFLKRMYRPCLMIIIKSCYLDCQIPELFTSFPLLCLRFMLCSDYLQIKAIHLVLHQCSALYCTLTTHVISMMPQTNQNSQKCKFCNNHKINKKTRPKLELGALLAELSNKR